MVSPIDKNTGDILSWQAGFALLAPTGDRATFSSYRGFNGPSGVPQTSQYLGVRESGGWTSESISAPRNAVNLYALGGSESLQLFKGFGEDLCSAGMVQDTTVPLASGAPPGVPNLYRRINCGPCPFGAFEGAGGGCYELLTPVAPPGFGYEPGNSIYFPEYQGSSADDSRSVVRADAALTADACTASSKGIFQLYESIQGNGLTLVSVLPNGSPACSHSSAGTYQGLVNGYQEDSLHNAVSPDGTRVFWTNSPDATPVTPAGHDAGSLITQQGRIYLRVNIGEPQSAVSIGKCTEASKACTIRVSQLVSEEPARFISADPETKSAIFMAAGSLYRFDLEPTPKAVEISGGVKGVVGASEDLARVYLISSQDHTPGQTNSEGEEAEEGGLNLYLYEEGAGFSFVAGLSSGDIPATGVAQERPTLMTYAPNRRTSRISEDGRQVVFTSAAPLTGFDNRDAVSGQADTEVFLFDLEVEGGSLVCVSCNPSGARPQGRLTATIENGAIEYWTVARVPGWAQALRPTRVLSESGAVFFESFEPLVLRDANAAADVYEWRRAATKEQCLKDFGGEVFVSSSDGCLSLISAGQGSIDANFLDASADGSDVLIATNSSLVPQDPGAMDVYDARVNGGFPPPPVPPANCQAGACQSPSSPPDDAPAASSEFRGAGNVREKSGRRCGKGNRKVKKQRRVRCVKVKKHRTSHSKGASR